MNVELVRKIDYYLGIPLCLIFTLWNKLARKFVKDKINKPRKILFLELSEMGSAILGYPAMKKAKELYPKAEIYFWIFKKNADSVHILNILPKNNVITMRNDNFFALIIDTIRNLWNIRRKGIDTIIDMELFSRFTSILSFLSGAILRIGFYKYCLEGLYRANVYTHKVVYNSYEHMSNNFLSLVESIAISSSELPMPKKNYAYRELSLPKIESADERKSKIWKKLKSINNTINENNKIVILNPLSSQYLLLRKWPEDSYIELGKRLLKDQNIWVIVIGVGDSQSVGQSIISEINSPRCINLIGKTTLAELLDLFNISHLLITHDSGPPNFAALTSVPVIVMFGPETPVLYSPLNERKTVIYKNFACSPCVSAFNHRKSLCKDNKCLQAISVDEVCKQAKSIIIGKEYEYFSSSSA